MRMRRCVLLEDQAGEDAPGDQLPASHVFLVRAACCRRGVVAIAAWLMYRMLGGWEDVQIAEQLGRIEQSAQPEDVLALIDRITVAQRRVLQTPTMRCYWVNTICRVTSRPRRCDITSG